MLKVNERKNEQNTAKIYAAVKQSERNNEYEVVYGYQEKNYILFKMIHHFAIGHNDQEVILVPIDKDSDNIGQVQKYVLGSEVKMTLNGSVALDNGIKKHKVVVPGMVPSLPGTKHLEIEQLQNLNSLVTKIKTMK